MDLLTNQYGYDDSLFISEPPEFLQCVVCSMVLRDPVQILRCGHKFCAVCFKRIQAHSKIKDTDILCPIDREKVDLGDVREDVAVKRLVGSLAVRCFRQELGCRWTGNLLDLKVHANKCSYLQKVKEDEDVANEVQKLRDRVLDCEKSLQQKDEDISMLKAELMLRDRVLNCEKSLQQKDKDISMLKAELKQMKKFKKDAEETISKLPEFQSVLMSVLQTLQQKQQVQQDELKTQGGQLNAEGETFNVKQAEAPVRSDGQSGVDTSSKKKKKKKKKKHTAASPATSPDASPVALHGQNEGSCELESISEIDEGKSPQLETAAVALGSQVAKPQPSQYDAKEIDEDKACVICMEMEYDTLFAPCGHCCLCFECATKLRAKDEGCPLCGGKVENVYRVYTKDT